MDARSRGQAYVWPLGVVATGGGDANDAFRNDRAERLAAPCHEALRLIMAIHRGTNPSRLAAG